MAMRKLLYSLILGGIIAAVAPAVPASASTPTFPSFEEVTGTGTLGQFSDPTVRADVIQFGQSAVGRTLITYPDGTFVAGLATCLSVTGDTAYITSRITFAYGPMAQARSFLSGNYVVIGIQATNEPPDLLNFSSGMASDPGCGPNPAATPVFPIVRGGFLVFSPALLTKSSACGFCSRTRLA